MNLLKLILLTTFSTIISQVSYSQERTYFDAKFVKVDEENALYYRDVEKKSDSLFAVKDYYITGELQFDGFFSNLEKETYCGLLNWYSKSGKKQRTSIYNQANLVENTRYYKDGTFRYKSYYKAGVIFNGFEKSVSYYTEYKDGNVLRKVRYYSDEKSIAEEKIFKKYTGTYSFYKGNYFPLKNIFYNKNGDEIAVVFYSSESENRINEGVLIDFYIENMNAISIKRKTHFEAEKKEGKSTFYKKNGEIWVSGIYKANKKIEGQFLDRYIISSYKDGVKIDNQISLNNNYKPIATVSIVNGDYSEGKTLSNNNNKLETYSNGNLIFEEAYYSKVRKVLKSTTIFSKENKSSTKWYNEKGVFLGRLTYKNNKPYNGFYIHYGPEYVNYKNGLKHGIEKIYSGRKDKFISETMYENDEILWRKTINPSQKNNMHLLTYKHNKPYEGTEYKYLFETVYKNGEQIEKSTYRNASGEGVYIGKTEYFKNGDSRPLKRTVFRNNKSYTLVLKYEGKHYSSPVSGIDWEYVDRKTTYKDGKAEGPYTLFKNGKSVEEGNYVNDMKQGIVIFKREGDPQTECIYDLGEPVTGTVMNFNTKISYLNGAKNGLNIERIQFDYDGNKGIESTTYKNGIKEGLYIVTRNRKPYCRGEYKNNKPYHGYFYNFNEKTKENYVEGKKQGIFKDYKSNAVTYFTTYNLGKIIQEKTYCISKQAKDSLLSEGVYKNNKPFSGSFLKEKSYKIFTKSQFNKGIKEGTESLINFEDFKIIEEQRISYVKGKKSGYYFNKEKDQLPNGIQLIEGYYKTDKPDRGMFITTDQAAMIVISTFKNGLKDGVEYYFSKKGNIIDSLFYRKGKINEGTALEHNSFLFYENNFFKHNYKNGKLITTKADFRNIKYEVTYTDKGFDLNFMGGNTSEINIKLIYDDAHHKSGRIDYFKNTSPSGSLFFNDGKLTKGKVDISNIHSDLKKYEKIQIEVVNNKVETSCHLATAFGYYEKSITSSNTEKAITVKSLVLISNGFSQNIQSETLMKTYLNNGEYRPNRQNS